MLDPWLAWRFAKFLGIGLFTLGLGGALLSREQSRRMTAVHTVATLGLFVTWTAGYGLIKISGASIRDPWVATSLFASFLALHEAAAVAERPRVLAINVALTVGAYAVAVGSMVARIPGPTQVTLTWVVPLGLAALAFALTRRNPTAHDAEPSVVGPATRRWFLLIARAEGVSLLALLLLYMPLKYGAGILLDGGQGWFGWVHGVMVFLYMQALWSATRRLGWSWGRAATAFAASLVPFGTFAFERALNRDAT